MKNIAVLFLYLASTAAFCQNIQSVDSLENKLNTLDGVDRASALYELVYAYLRKDVSKARVYHQQVKAESLKEKDPGAKAYLSMALGIYASRNGLLDSGVYFLEEAERFAITANNNPALVRTHLSLGHAHISSGKPERGLEMMFKGLRVLDKFPDMEIEMKLRTNIGWAYLELKQYRNCITHGVQNLRLMEGTSFEWIALYTYNNVAVSYGALGIIDSAKYYIEKGIRAATKTNDFQSLANGYFILGTIYSNASQYDLAIEQYLKEAYQGNNRFSDRNGEIKGHHRRRRR